MGVYFFMTLDLPTLLPIARLAEKLNVPLRVCATLDNWNDVIKLKALLVPASDTLAFVSLPDEHPRTLRYSLSSRTRCSREVLKGVNFLPHPGQLI